MSNESPLSAIIYTRSPPSLKVLNQLLLPHKTVYEIVTNVQEGYEQIKQMKVRGAPAIGIVAALSLAIDLLRYSNQTNSMFNDQESLKCYIKSSLDHLKTSRPTAVNLFRASDILWNIIEKENDVNIIIQKLVKESEKMLTDDIRDNENIGRFGAKFIMKENKNNETISVVTHCNTGSLATAGYGTALGIIRSLHSQGELSHVYFTETRPYNQGARLTAYELIHDKIPSTLICDSMVSALLSNENSIKAIIVGADRVASNGDTANKIGTYQLAITAKYHNKMFIVAAPSTSIDLNIKSSNDIIIEERDEDEIIYVNGMAKNNENGELEIKKVRLPPEGVKVWNPSFDVTPAELITAIITEKGVVTKDNDTNKFNLSNFLK